MSKLLPEPQRKYSPSSLTTVWENSLHFQILPKPGSKKGRGCGWTCGRTCATFWVQTPVQFNMVLDLKSASHIPQRRTYPPVTMACYRSYFICFQKYLDKAEQCQEKKLRDTPLKQPAGCWLKNNNIKEMICLSSVPLEVGGQGLSSSTASDTREICKHGLWSKFFSHCYSCTNLMTFLWERDDSALGVQSRNNLIRRIGCSFLP